MGAFWWLSCTTLGLMAVAAAYAYGMNIGVLMEADAPLLDVWVAAVYVLIVPPLVLDCARILARQRAFYLKGGDQ